MYLLKQMVLLGYFPLPFTSHKIQNVVVNKYIFSLGFPLMMISGRSGFMLFVGRIGHPLSTHLFVLSISLQTTTYLG